MQSLVKTDEHSGDTEHALCVARNRIDALENELFALKNHSDGLQRKIDFFHRFLLWRTSPLKITLNVLAYTRSMAANMRAIWSISRWSRRVKDYLGSRWRVCQIRRKKDQRAAEAELKAFLDSERRLIFSSSREPEVSIILVLFNQAPLTFRCLCSVARKVCTPYELIVVDNGSTDATSRVLDLLEGAEVIRNTTNLFFSRAVRQGAELAKAKYILLLNNDAVLQKGAVEYAVETLESSAEIGAVGGRVLLSEKVLQEAGSIIWRDGTCLGFGRGEYPEKPEFMFQRDVDYCSGAFLLLPRDLFRRLDYFDESFLPAYYEDTDLCMRLKKVGYRTVYDPRACIFHREFGSVNQDRAIALQEKHRVLFVDKHKQQLDRRHLPADSHNVLWARAQLPPTGKRVLVVDARVPDPSLGAGFPRAQQIVRVLQELGHFVTFYPLLYSKDAWKDVYSVLPLKVEVMLGYGVMRLEEFMIERVNYYDKIIVSRPDNMAVLRCILKRRPDLRGKAEVIYDAEALFSLRTIKRAEVLGKPLSQQKCKQLLAKEFELASFADQVVVVSENEANYYSAHGCQRLKVLGHSIEPQPTISLFHERKGFLFVGALDFDKSPNTDSLAWFVDEVMPILRSKLGDELVLRVIGRNEARRTRKLVRPDVHFLGRVPQLNGHYDQARIFIAPTRFAAGIPHKIHEAAAHGVPVVATAMVADQLGWSDRCDLLVADDAEKFAGACEELYRDEALWYSIRQKALERIRNECSPDRFRQKLGEIVN